MKSFYPNVQILRGIAAMMVVFYHFTHHSDYHGVLLPDGYWLKELGSFGPTGVFVFFVISGFVIPLSMIESEYQPRHFFRFFLRRLVRLEPPYLATIALLLFVSWYFSFQADLAWEFSLPRLLSHFLYLVQFTGQEWYNPIFWTLAIEFQFYIFLGITLPLLNHRIIHVRLGYLVLLCLSGLLLNERALLFPYLPVFAMGISLVLFKKHKLELFHTLLIAVLGLICTTKLHSLDFAVASALAYVFIGWVSIEWKPLMWLGGISYSLYLTHGISGGNFLYLFQFRNESIVWKLSLLFLAIAGSVFCAWIFYRVVEKTARKWAAKIRR